MKVISVPLFLGLTAICAHCAVLRLPEPPQQHSPWHPDPAIPTNILSAVDMLYEQGFPDPRGCEYREIEVEVSGVWDGKARLVKTRGWVLPTKSGTNQFAICWNGLIYPVAKVSALADLQAEISNQLRSVSLSFTNQVNGTNVTYSRVYNPAFHWRYSAPGESATVFFTNALSTRVLLLLRCGETAAALTNWAPDQQMMFGGFGAGGRPVSNNDPYLEYAGDWAWAMFDRMISALQRGDEALALAAAQQLAEVQPKIEAECARRGFQRPQYPTPDWSSKPGPYLGFLDQLPQILADLERRAKEPAKTNIIEAGITNYPDQTNRIAALVDDLDLVQARQWSQPGWVNLPDDPIVAALIQEGDPAVEPLLNCLENDKRLTRSVGFGRDFFRGRTVIPVHDAARVALLSILRAGFKDDAPEIRAYWNKYKGLKLEDRWYAILDDDSANARWGEAAANIVQPENVQRFPGGLSISKPAPTNASVRMDGEILRAKTNPSIAELMARRALEVPTDNPNAYDLSAACQMGLCLAAWDARAAGPVAETLLKRCSTVLEYSDQQSSRYSQPNQRMGTFMAKLTLACAQNGDTNVFEYYAAWLKTTTPEQLGGSYLECLEPLFRFPTNQVLKSAAENIFNNTNSSWGQLPWKNIADTDPVEHDLVNVPAFRQLLICELGKTNNYVLVEWRAPNWFSYQTTTGGSGGRTLAFPEGENPADGTKTTLRWCDWIAFLLSNKNQIPFFDPFAPVVERDAAIKTAKELLGE